MVRIQHHLTIVALMLGCSNSAPEISEPTAPATLVANPLDDKWPDLVGHRIEVTGKLVRVTGEKGPNLPQIYFNRTFLDVGGQFNDDAFAADQIKVLGTLTRVHHSRAPHGGQAGASGRVWETFLLVVDEWNVVKLPEGQKVDLPDIPPF